MLKFKPGDIVLLDVTIEDVQKYGMAELLSSIRRIESVCEDCDRPYELNGEYSVKEYRLLRIEITLADVILDAPGQGVNVPLICDAI